MLNSKPRFPIRAYYKEIDPQIIREMHQERVKNEKDELKNKYQETSEQLKNLIIQFDELSKNYNILCSNNETLKNENQIIPKIKEEFDKYKIESKQKIEGLNSNLLDTKKQLQEKIKLTLNLESDFMNVLRKVLNLSQEEQGKTLQEMQQIFFYLESHNIKTKEKKEVPEEKELEPFNLREYIDSRECFDGNEKRVGAKGCEDCAKLCNNLRNKYGSRELAWQEIWRKHGKIAVEIPVETMQESMEIDDNLTTSCKEDD